MWFGVIPTWVFRVLGPTRGGLLAMRHEQASQAVCAPPPPTPASQQPSGVECGVRAACHAGALGLGGCVIAGCHTFVFLGVCGG